ncbi:MAG: 2TM domain-containing protein [Deltaproteobacteria bacterium]|nr:2TM domain-containing protein [Deltaproteobacteria bacterium]
MASREAKTGFGYHLAAYVTVNAILVWINIDMFPHQAWAQWPMIGWGIGLAFHGLTLVSTSQKQNRGLFYHLAAYMIINAVLIFINLTTMPDLLWFKYPLIIWTCMIAFHFWRVFPKYRSTNAS